MPCITCSDDHGLATLGSKHKNVWLPTRGVRSVLRCDDVVGGER